ncbi:MAG: hypothetical protein M1816_000518 [Peltula sp. TS41687]|nr:MAG: hypothetical protein M1816_000518 [Peltula sp. TS41687]
MSGSSVIALFFAALAQTTHSAALPASPDTYANYPGPGSTCCDRLARQFPIQVVGMGTQNYTTYDSQFWSSSASLAPRCIFAPTYAEEVSTAVKLFASQGCKFAVRGGGHSAVPGAANTNDGILITFANMKNVSLHTDSGVEYVSVQPGATWGEVYTYTDQFAKVPVAGRFYPVGTGLALGAGFSFLANERGFAVDNVKAYQIVLANGTIVEASQTRNADLFRAQKGGGDNFGVVTRYDLLTYEGGPVVGGIMIGSENQTENWLDQTYDYAVRQAVQDVKTHALPAIAYIASSNQVVPETVVYYNDHHSSVLPPIMSGWNNVSAVSNTVRQASYASLAREYATGFDNGLFQEQRVYTIKADRKEFGYVWYRFLTWARSIGNVDGFNILHCNMPMTPHMMETGVEKGGNSLGLAGTKDNLSVLYFGITMKTRNDNVVNSFRSLFTDLESHSQAQSLQHPYIMWNYAGIGQDVIRSYGKRSTDFMRSVRARYDPTGVFQRLVTGGFKL